MSEPCTGRIGCHSCWGLTGETEGRKRVSDIGAVWPDMEQGGIFY